MRKYQKYLIIFIGSILFLCAFSIAIPGIRNRLIWRFDQLRTRIFYSLNPPEEVVFVPNETTLSVEEIVQATFQAATAMANIAPTIPVIETQVIDSTPVPTPTLLPLPSQHILTGIRYEDQHGLWNYCAPSTLSMALSYWGWDGDRVTAGKWLKPFEKDKNVMLSEMQSFVNEQTNLRAIVRHGGTLNTLKRLIAGGFPVVIEKGTYIRETTTGKLSWMGHYNVLTGFDDEKKHFIAQDSYYSADYLLDYSLLEEEWRSFNYIFLVAYPPERELELLELIPSHADVIESNQYALQITSEEIPILEGADKFFALFNRGTSLVQLQDYYGAAQAYDMAFALYPSLEKEIRPWRMMWYQTGPYFAYYYSGRYQDVIDLATTTIDAASEPYIEENFYWRARARVAVGDLPGAVEDLRTSLEYHPDFSPSVMVLQELGYTP